MSKELQKKESNLPAEATNMDEWGGSQISAKDMTLPRIQAMQFMSDPVKEGEAKYGEFRDTMQGHVLGNLDTPFEIVPFHMEKKWVEYNMVPKKQGGFSREFSQIVAIQDNPNVEGYNDDLPLIDEDGQTERDRVLDFYVLLPTELAEGVSFPYVIRFKRTSMKAGQKLATQMYVMNRAAGKVPAATVMQISGKTKENDDGEFVVMDTKPTRPSTKEELEEALKWFKLVRGGATKVDEGDYEAPETQAKGAAQETEF